MKFELEVTLLNKTVWFWFTVPVIWFSSAGEFTAWAGSL